MKTETQRVEFPDENEFQDVLKQYQVVKRKNEDDWDIHLLGMKLEELIKARLLAMVGKGGTVQ